MKKASSAFPIWLLWCGLFLGASALAFAFYLNNSLTSGAISNSQQMQVLWVFNILGGPGIAVSEIFGNSGSFWISHAPAGDGYFNTIAVFYLYNTSGWIVLLLVALHFIRYIKSMRTPKHNISRSISRG